MNIHLYTHICIHVYISYIYVYLYTSTYTYTYIRTYMYGPLWFFHESTCISEVRQDLGLLPRLQLVDGRGDQPGCLGEAFWAAFGGSLYIHIYIYINIRTYIYIYVCVCVCCFMDFMLFLKGLGPTQLNQYFRTSPCMLLAEGLGLI